MKKNGGSKTSLVSSELYIYYFKNVLFSALTTTSRQALYKMFLKWASFPVKRIVSNSHILTQNWGKFLLALNWKTCLQHFLRFRDCYLAEEELIHWQTYVIYDSRWRLSLLKKSQSLIDLILERGNAHLKKK